ncbi:MAG: arginine N-succinyltransferase, partial [Verrucomicrobiota bacterium]
LVPERSGPGLRTCGNASNTGGFHPFDAYQIEKEPFTSPSLQVDHEVEVLTLYAEHNGPGEIGSLLLSKEGRGTGLGGLLSRSRFLFVAEHPSFFEETIVAELRGVVDEEGKSPFWDAIAAHFFTVDYPRADQEVLRGKEFIADLIPRHPIYVPMLPQEAQKVIGKVHPHTRPAQRMLEQEGFAANGLVDLFEAGPVMECARDEIRTVKHSHRANVHVVQDAALLDTPAWIGTTTMDFRCCEDHISLPTEGTNIDISAEAAEALQVTTNTPVRYCLKP